MTTVLDELTLPSGWNEIPFRSVAKKVSEAGFPALESLSVFLDAGVVPRSSREDNHNQLGESLDKYQRVMPNDLVFNKLRTWQGGFGISNYEGIVSPAYIIARPDLNLIEPRFLGYLLKSKPYLAELTRLSKWMPPTQFDISWESIRDLKLRIPSLNEQKSMADLLDSQITLTDQIIAIKKSQISLIWEIVAAKMSEKFLVADGKKIRIKRLISDEKLGIWGEEPGVNPVDVLVARVADFNRNEFQLNAVETHRSVEFSQFKTRKIEKGDILLERSGGGEKSPVGCAVYVSEDFSNLVCSNFVSRVRSSSEVDSSYLALLFAALYSCGMQRPHSSQTTGIQNLDTESYFQTEVPFRELPEQIELARYGRELLVSAAKVIDYLDKSIIAMQNFKSSLITSVVTGTYNFPSGRSVA